MWQRAVRGVTILLLLCTALPATAATDNPSAFIADLGRQAIEILQTQEELPARKTAFSKLFTEDFDVPAIGKFVLGRYCKTATPEQQSQYLKAFGQYIVGIYATRFSNYSGEQFKVLGTKSEDAMTATVSSQILRPNGGPPYAIDWQVAKEGDRFKITNVMVENVSMALTQRQEFASVIEQNGGSVAALIAMLQQKVQQG